jgi:hypothetical protein
MTNAEAKILDMCGVGVTEALLEAGVSGIIALLHGVVA